MSKKPEVIKPPHIPHKWKAFSVERVHGGWQMVTISLEDDNIADIERTQPDLKMVALEQFKIAAFKYWTGEVAPVFSEQKTVVVNE